MENEELAKEVSNWEKWSYTITHKEITCFTAKVIDFDEKKKMWVITYKPEAWFADVELKDVWRLWKIKELRKNFRFFKSSWFTEREKGELCEQIDGVDEFFDNH